MGPAPQGTCWWGDLLVLEQNAAGHVCLSHSANTRELQETPHGTRVGHTRLCGPRPELPSQPHMGERCLAMIQQSSLQIEGTGTINGGRDRCRGGEKQAPVCRLQGRAARPHNQVSCGRGRGRMQMGEALGRAVPFLAFQKTPSPDPHSDD